MEHKNITFIGAGNMARAIVLGMLNAFYPSEQITMSNRSAEKLVFFEELETAVCQNNQNAVANADVVILAVKPNQIGGVCQEIAAVLPPHALVISVAAGITTEFIDAQLGGDRAVVRAMPNTGSAVSAGVTGLFANAAVTDEQDQFAEALFSAISLVVWLEDEHLIPVVSAVSGAGIAYYFRFMEIMQQEAINLGLPEDVVKFMVAQTALGAAKLALESDKGFAELRSDVASPNGTTQSAITAMDNAQLEAVIVGGMQAAIERSKEMTEELCNF